MIVDNGVRICPQCGHLNLEEEAKCRTCDALIAKQETNVWLVNASKRAIPPHVRYVYVWKGELTPEVYAKAWEVVLENECDNQEDKDSYAFLFADDPNYNADDVLVTFHEYWGEYGWHLMQVLDDAEIPHDMRVAS